MKRTYYYSTEGNILMYENETQSIKEYLNSLSATDSTNYSLWIAKKKQF